MVDMKNTYNQAEKFIDYIFTQSYSLAHKIVNQLWLFPPFLGQFQHVGHQKYVLEL